MSARWVINSLQVSVGNILQVRVSNFLQTCCRGVALFALGARGVQPWHLIMDQVWTTHTADM